MDTAQVWTMIGSLMGVMGVFSAIMIATFTMLRSSLLAEVRSEIRGLRSDVEVRLATVDARFDRVDARFDRVDARFDAVDARFDAVDVRLSALEGDMHLVKAHLIGQRTA